MKRYGFLLLEGYALMSTAAAMEPFRVANLFASKTLYDIVPLSLSEAISPSSLPAHIRTTPLDAAKGTFDIVFVVAGGNPLKIDNAFLVSWLRELDRQGVPLGAISGGAAILAKAGLLDNRRFTIHWHHIDELKALSDRFLIEQRLYVIDRDRFTCAGGTAPLDMMYAIISQEHGKSFARRISDWLIQTEIRISAAPQQGSIAARYGAALPRPVLEAYELMETHIADPLELQQLAQLIGLSARQLQRQFKQTQGCSVMRSYRKMRLDIALDLIKNSALPIGEIALMTGFSSQALFSDAFKQHFGIPPGRTRALKNNI